MREPVILPRNCANCQHWDGEGWCALSIQVRVLGGHIVRPAEAVCVQHEPQESDDVDGAAI